MDIIHNVINAVTSLPPSFWASVGAYLGGGSFIALIVQVTKHKFNFADAKKGLLVVNGFLSAVASSVEFIVQTGGALATAVPEVGGMSAKLMLAAIVMHRFFVSPLYYKISDKINGLSIWLDKVAAYQSGQKANTNAPVANIAVEPKLPAESDLKQFEVK